MNCSRRLYKGNSYDVCFPIADTGVTMARFYTQGDIVIEKEPEITGDSMCFSFTEEDIAALPDGVLRYELVTDYETIDTNTEYVVVTPVDYSGTTLDEILEEAYLSGYTEGYDSGYTDGGESAYESGYTSGYGDGYQSGYTDGLAACSGQSSYEDMYLTIEALEDGDMYLIQQSGRSIEYNINETGWQYGMGFAEPIEVKAGDKIQIRFTLQYPERQMIWSPFDTTEFRFNVYGNILSVVYGDDFNKVPMVEAHALTERFFGEWTKPVDASNLVLPEVIDADYSYMFEGCTTLTGAPEMHIYRGTNCNGMFKGCSNLSYIKCIASSTGINTVNWVDGVAPTGTFETQPTAQWLTGVNGIPTGWTRVDSN